jgi:hypothetical protein
MLKHILISVLIITVSFSCYAESNAISDEYILSCYDKFEHTPKEFLSILSEIQYYKPNYSKEEIGEILMLTWRYVRRHGVHISVYETSQGVKRFSKDKLGIDLKTLAASYGFSQIHME